MAIIILDAQYGADAAGAACVIAAGWDAAMPLQTDSEKFVKAAEYEPGAFYKRELPLLRSMMPLGCPISAIIIDGYVWLSGDHRALGLGAHLSAALASTWAMPPPIIGIAKTRYRGDDWSTPVRRGQSGNPLFVTAIGMAGDEAAALVQQMHGDHRVPTLVRSADQAARAALASDRPPRPLVVFGH
jgi:deoxyribonuclease V